MIKPQVSLQVNSYRLCGSWSKNILQIFYPYQKEAVTFNWFWPHAFEGDKMMIICHPVLISFPQFSHLCYVSAFIKW